MLIPCYLVNMVNMCFHYSSSGCCCWHVLFVARKLPYTTGTAKKKKSPDRKARTGGGGRACHVEDTIEERKAGSSRVAQQVIHPVPGMAGEEKVHVILFVYLFCGCTYGM